jgi:hypothetical protein
LHKRVHHLRLVGVQVGVDRRDAALAERPRHREEIDAAFEQTRSELP